MRRMRVDAVVLDPFPLAGCRGNAAGRDDVGKAAVARRFHLSAELVGNGQCITTVRRVMRYVYRIALIVVAFPTAVGWVSHDAVRSCGPSRPPLGQLALK